MNRVEESDPEKSLSVPLPEETSRTKLGVSKVVKIEILRKIRRGSQGIKGASHGGINQFGLIIHKVSIQRQL
ncbi:hypothetical protein MLD38_022825 [Melastoma candidum]|uniref:Uncharacterized protein n=1 Tax=Melastoma candidum TaxID=119954 RepID=A0ACB9QNL9_9MYRT|nr:hypothetical protein MLD38_022825 [Melastoma candidum]